MFGLPLAFGAPAVLFGLLALPVIWWLLRLTPPRPQSEVFAPLKILARVIKREETPHKSPWWLTLLRLMLAALVIVALAEPMLNPRERSAVGTGPLALVVDNGWAAASDWDERARMAADLIADAGDAGQPVLLAFTAEPADAEIGPFESAVALKALRATAPRPVPGDRNAVLARVAGALDTMDGATLAYISDGLAGAANDTARDLLGSMNAGKVLWYEAGGFTKTGLAAVDNTATAFELTAIRSAAETAPRTATAGAFDDKGRRIAEATIAFAAGSPTATAEIAVPFELRNDFASLVIDGEESAAATRVLDESSRRRRIGLISAAEADQAQPLLSPLYYIRNALEPYADLIEPPTADLAESIPFILDRKPAIVVLADVETIPPEAHDALVTWVEKGGTLIRFAGPRLASADNESEDDLLPVRLRRGERALGGTLSWTEPQPVAEFPAVGPFSGLTPPREVTVRRQVLAEPTPDIVERTWANLADGTPLVTGAAKGDGTVVLFHITPQATWSNLPISGTFVSMLRRIIAISSNQGRAEGETPEAQQTLAPYRMIDAAGRLGPPPPQAKPLVVNGTEQPVTLDNPPGLYGTEDGVVAHNLLAADARFEPFEPPAFQAPLTRAPIAAGQAVDLKPLLLLAALILLALDALIVMALAGLFARSSRRFAKAGAAAGLAIAVIGLSALFAANNAMADDSQPGDADAIAAITQTRLAYVVTGNPALDAVSRAGLKGLSTFLATRTALEPGEPAGVDPETDELAFYPIIYWPMDESSDLPSPAAIARIDAYMQQGGTVLFDTRDQYSSGFGFDDSTSPTTQRLRTILSSINVPPLEPVPPDHVLTKSFFILDEFPGRFRGSPLWVEASLDAVSRENRPVRTGDGVSPILITGNDFAGAWAVDASGLAMYPTVPSDPLQRIHAYRTGVNIVMYMLTGNYKSDQVHIPALLERLGQ